MEKVPKEEVCRSVDSHEFNPLQQHINQAVGEAESSEQALLAERQLSMRAGKGAESRDLSHLDRCRTESKGS